MPFFISKKDTKNFVRDSFKKMYNVTALKQFSKHLPANALILDLGCGGGQDALFLAKQGYKVVGIDIMAEMIKLAKKKAKHSNIIFKKTSFELFSSTKKFDGIWCAKVFQFITIETQQAFIRKAYFYLKPNGVLYITSKTTENKKDYELPDGGRGTVRKRLTRKTFETILRKTGFRIIHSKYWENKIGMEIIAKKSKF